jgi:hypothetical protein
MRRAAVIGRFLRSPIRLFVSLAVGLLVTGFALAQTTVTIQQGLNGYTGTADSKIACCTFADTNYGADWEYDLIGDTSTSLLIRFAIFDSEGGPVPASATITAATLSLYQFNGQATTWAIYRLLKNWSEPSVTWNVTGTGSSWSTPGVFTGDIAATPEATASTPDVGSSCAVSPPPESCWLNLNVTASVQAFASGTPNFGWKLSDTSGNGGTPRDFNSKENGNWPTLRPKLTVAYTLPSSTCGSGTLRPYDGVPVNSNPIAVPAVFEAEDFNCGGQNVAYHDNVAGNAGNANFRTSEDVDIVTSPGAANGSFVVNNFETGEWLTYTISVASAGTYDIGVRASNNLSPAQFHIEIDDLNQGAISVPLTGSWDAFNWYTLSSVSLTAGQHVLKLYADLQYANVDQLRVVASATSACGAAPLRPYSGSPINGNVIQVPATFDAEDFNCGGEGVAYHDVTSPAGPNAGQTFRVDEGVQIVATAGGGLAVNNFNTGEWMTYTISVGTAGNYDLGVLASNNLQPSAFHIEIDGVNVTGSISVPLTGSWDVFQWLTKPAVSLSAGQHALKLVSDQQWFNVDQLRVLASGAGGGTGGGGTNPPNLLFRSGWESGVSLATPTDCYSNGCWQDTNGTDASTGFTWPPNIYGGGTRFQLLTNSPTTPTPSTVGTWMHQSIVAGGHSGSNALYQEISQSGCCGTASQGNGATQDPLLLLPTRDATDLYVSYWMKLQSNLASQLAGQWRNVFEIKTADIGGIGPDWRFILAVVAFNGTPPQFRIVIDHYYPSYDRPVDLFIPTSTVAVPVDPQWFKVEVFWHRSSGADGRVWTAINGVTVFDQSGPNMGTANAPMDRIFLTNPYTGGIYPLFQWVDDLQIWTSFPTATSADPSYDPPYGPH